MSEHGAKQSCWSSIGHAPLWTSTHMILVWLKDKPCSEWTRISLLNVLECRFRQSEEFSQADDDVASPIWELASSTGPFERAKTGVVNTNKDRFHLFVSNHPISTKEKRRFILGIYWPRPRSTKLAKKIVPLCWYLFQSGSSRQSGFGRRKGVKWDGKFYPEESLLKLLHGLFDEILDRRPDSPIPLEQLWKRELGNQ